MAEITNIKAARTAATRARIGGGLDALVVDLRSRGKAADEAAEADRIRRIVATELGLAMQKAYVLLGLGAADDIIVCVHAGKRQEHTMKAKIKGE